MHHLEQQATHLGIEACKTHEQRADYIRMLVRGIFQSDLSGIHVIGETRIVSGETSMTTIPEFERVFDVWRDFPRQELAQIIREEQDRAKGSPLKLVKDSSDSDGTAEADSEQAA